MVPDFCTSSLVASGTPDGIFSFFSAITLINSNDVAQFNKQRSIAAQLTYTATAGVGADEISDSVTAPFFILNPCFDEGLV